MWYPDIKTWDGSETDHLAANGNFHTAFPLQVPELSSPKDVRQREQTVSSLWGIPGVSNLRFISSVLLPSEASWEIQAVCCPAFFLFSFPSYACYGRSDALVFIRS